MVRGWLGVGSIKGLGTRWGFQTGKRVLECACLSYQQRAWGWHHNEPVLYLQHAAGSILASGLQTRHMEKKLKAGCSLPDGAVASSMGSTKASRVCGNDVLDVQMIGRPSYKNCVATAP